MQLGSGYAFTDYYSQGMSFKGDPYFLHLGTGNTPLTAGNFRVPMTRSSTIEEVFLLAAPWGNQAEKVAFRDKFIKAFKPDEILKLELQRLRNLNIETLTRHQSLWDQCQKDASRSTLVGPFTRTYVTDTPTFLPTRNSPPPKFPNPLSTTVMPIRKEREESSHPLTHAHYKRTLVNDSSDLLFTTQGNPQSASRCSQKRTKTLSISSPPPQPNFTEIPPFSPSSCSGFRNGGNDCYVITLMQVIQSMQLSSYLANPVCHNVFP